MPFKSESQRRKFRQLVADGKLSQETYDKWESETKEKLPEKAGRKSPAIRKPRRVR